jgi:hypothetical protein
MQSALPELTSAVCPDGTQSITTKISDNDDGCKEKT